MKKKVVKKKKIAKKKKAVRRMKRPNADTYTMPKKAYVICKGKRILFETIAKTRKESLKKMKKGLNEKHTINQVLYIVER